MPKKQFTTGEAAEFIGVPRETLRSWMHKGWAEHVQVERALTGKWTHFTPGDVVVLRVAKEFAQFIHPHLALQAAAMCRAGILLYKFENRVRSRFVGVALFLKDGETMACPASAESVGEFQNKDWSHETWASAKPDGSYSASG